MTPASLLADIALLCVPVLKSRVQAPYARAIELLKSGSVSSPQRRSEYAAIAELPPAWGRELDRMGAPHYVVRWVAGASLRRLDLVEQRYLAVRAFLLDGKTFTRETFDELVDSHQKLEPRRGGRGRLRRLVRAALVAGGAQFPRGTG